MRRQYYVILVLLGHLAVAFVPPAAQASCAARSPEELFAGATVVFRGRAGAIDPPRTDPRAVYFAPARVTFTVDTRWKGAVPPMMVVVVNPAGSASSHVEVREGDEFLVYAAGRHPDGLYADSCTGTRPIRHAAELLSSLGPGMPPTDEQPLPDLPNTGSGDSLQSRAPVAVATVGGGLIALGLLWRRQHRRRRAR